MNNQLPNNTLKSIKTYFIDSLNEIYPKSEILIFFYWLAEEYLNLTKTEVVSHLNNGLSESDILKFHFALKKLKNQEPIQYILGYTWFYYNKFIVAKEVLIPRPETEELVDWINESHEKHTILDIGTGSGCIAISLALANSNFKVFATDVSENALIIANKNAINLNAKVNFYSSDILNDQINNKYDIIVSNPPYIPEFEKVDMSENVLAYEPHQALFVPNNNPLIFYEIIAKKAFKALNPSGYLYFEIHEDYGDEVKEMIKKVGFVKVEIKKDLQGKNRMIRARVYY